MNSDKSSLFFLLLFTIYFYEIPYFILFYYFKFFLNSLFQRYNDFIDNKNWFSLHLDNDEQSQDKNISLQDSTNVLKYEDKYLEAIRKMNKEWIFTEEENNDILEFSDKFFIQNKEKKMKELLDLKSSDDNLFNEETLKEKELDELKIQSESEAKEHVIHNKLNKIENSYIIEKTPIGNVLMNYSRDKECFVYYSDSTIPYRYLEVAARKFIKILNCRPIYIDMEEELKIFEEKWEIKNKEIEKLKEEEKTNVISKKKSVFAQFKSYNKDVGGKISMAPPKNSIPNKVINENKENEKFLLKERANKYVCGGKFANFNFSKKIDRKIFNKKLGLSFADFKKMKQI
jgi:hypothetical protein